MAQRESILSPLSNSIYIKIRQDFLELSGGDHCMAALLSYYEYKLNAIISNMEEMKLKNKSYTPCADDYFIECSPSFLSKALLGLFGRTKIIEANERLHEQNFITIKTEKIGNQYKTTRVALNIEPIKTSLLTLFENKQPLIQKQTTPYSDLNNPLFRNEQPPYSETDRINNTKNNLKEDIIINSPYGDGRLHYLCVQYAKENIDKYPKEFYVEFLQYWTAPIQKGTKIGKELWRDEKTFQIASRFNTSWNTVWKNRKQDNNLTQSQYKKIDTTKELE